MAKRFTDTDKWKKNWFLDLGPEGKLLWLFVLDYCDNAGICEFSPKVYSMCVGFKVTKEKLESLIGHQVKWISGNRFLISDFASFQYGKLKESNNAHKSVLEKLSQIDFIEDSGAAQPLRCPSRGDQDKEEDKDKDKDKEMVKEKDKEQEQVSELVDFWNTKKIIVHEKSKLDFGNLLKQLKKRKKYSIEEIKQAIDNYASVLHSDNYWTCIWTVYDFLGRSGADRFYPDQFVPEAFASKKQTRKLSPAENCRQQLANNPYDQEVA